MDATEATPIPAPGVERKIGLAWMALAWEGIWPRLMPLLAMVALFIAAAHLDLFGGLDPWVHTGVLAALALGFVGLAWWRFRDFHLAGPRTKRDPPPRAGFAACRTGRWSPCRTRLAAGSHDQHGRGPVGGASPPRGRAAGRPQQQASASRPRRSSTPGRCGFVPLLALVVAVAVGRRLAQPIAWRPPSRRPSRRRRRWSPISGSRRRPIPASRRSISTWPSTTSCCACRSAASSRASSTTCAAAIRPSCRSTARRPSSAPSARASTRSSRSSPRARKIALQARGDEQARWKLHVIPDLRADHRVRQADRRRQVVDQDRLHRRRRFRRDRRAAADPPARLACSAPTC